MDPYPKDRIRLGKWQMAHPINSFLGRRATADVPTLVWRVRADYQEIVTSLQLAMANAGWKNDNITGVNFELVSILAAENELGMPAHNAENFMCRGVIVVKVVNAVTPLWRPAIKLKLRFEGSSRIGTCDGDRVPVEQNRQIFVIRQPAVPGKSYHLRLHCLGGWFHSVALLRKTQSRRAEHCIELSPLHTDMDQFME